jgi:hypothetical protein
MDTHGMSEAEQKELWEIQRECFRRWLVGLTDKQINEAGHDLYVAMEYRLKNKQDFGNLN